MQNEGSELRRAVSSFLLDCEARNLTPATLKYYTQRLRWIVAYLERQGVTAPADITPEHLRSFLLGFRQAGRSPFYQHQFYRVLKTWLRFLVREGVLTTSPLATVRGPKLPRTLLPPFTPADVKALLQACEYERDRALVLTLLDTGVRAAELLGLDVGDVNLDTGAVHVRHGKGQKDRVVFCGPVTRRALGRYLATRGIPAKADPLFVSLVTGDRFTFGGLSSALRRLGDRAGVKPIGAHRFRRTFAITSLRAGMDLATLAALMGHADLQIVQVYLYFVEEDLRTAQAQHGAVDALLR